MDPSDAELRRLRATVRDLTALSALPLLWVGERAPKVIGSFLDVLTAGLRLDLVYARVADPHGGARFELARSRLHAEAATRANEIGAALAPLLAAGVPINGGSVRDPLGNATLRCTAVPMGLGEDALVVAGCKRKEFPDDFDHALLAAAGNQATVWLNAERWRFKHELAEQENAWLREEVSAAPLPPAGMLGDSPALRALLSQIDMVAPTEATVLVLGESGTGKELVARAVHERSARAGRPLVKVNCSAIPHEMFESEFFGHVRGAFTSALRDRQGRFALADNGSIFLDEVGDLPLDLQPKLLRVLQEGQYERVGDDATRAVNVRVIAATNRDLAAEVRAGRFRQDLYYRLSVFPIQMPTLRERREDIAPLAALFCTQAARRVGCATPRIDIAQGDELARYDWPGNVRELQNVIERAVIMSRGGSRLRLDLVLPAQAEVAAPPPPERAPRTAQPSTLEQSERQHIVQALESCGWVIGGAAGAATLLGLPRTTLIYKMRKLGIERDR